MKQKSSKKAMGVSSPARSARPSAKITRRIVDKKRHTVGYVVNGKNMTVAQTRRLAESGSIAGIRVVGSHIQSEPGRRKLTDLPISIS